MNESLGKLTLDYLRELPVAAWNGWNRFWFSPSDPATLGMLRVLGGAMILYTHCVWSIDLLGFFGPQGRLSSEWGRMNNATPWAWSYLFWIESPGLLWTVHLFALVILAMFMLGLFTRVTSVLTFLIVVSYAHRASGALFGLDQINGMLALYLAIGPSGAAFSLDRLIARWRAGEALPVVPSTGANLAVRLVQVHMCLIYLFAGSGKLLGESWWGGEAMWITFANYEYQSMDMTWLAGSPAIIDLLTHITVLWELSYAVLVWPRWTRPIVIALAVPLHLGIALCMGMITFGLVMLIGNAAFISPRLVRAGLAMFPTGAGEGSAPQEAEPARGPRKAGRSRRKSARA